MPYGFIGSMKTQPGKREEVAAILLSGLDGLRSAGCVQYTVGVLPDDEVTIWTCEVWGSKEQHDASLQLPGAKATHHRGHQPDTARPEQGRHWSPGRADGRRTQLQREDHRDGTTGGRGRGVGCCAH